MPDNATAEGALARLLYIFPAAAREGGVPLQELADALDVSIEQVLDDIAKAVDRDFYHPAGSVLPRISVEGDRLHFFAGSDFKRPVRLTPREGLALELGLRAMAADAAPDRRAEILELANRLGKQLTALPSHDLAEPATRSTRTSAERCEPQPDRHATDREPLQDDPWPDIDAVLFEAAATKRHCRIAYLKPGDTDRVPRDVAPYRIVHAEGNWYVVGHDLARGSIRIFRFDRILAAELADSTFEVPRSFDPRALIEGGALFLAGEEATATIRYSPLIARWVIERTGAAPDPDGGVTVAHTVADPHWLIRHVLQYGGEATVLAPEDLRARVAEAAAACAGTVSAGPARS